MGNPTAITLTEGVITKVATNVVTGSIKKISAAKGATILETYRLTGEAAPTNKSEFALAFCDCIDEQISSTAAIDVYMFARGGDAVVRSDI